MKWRVVGLMFLLGASLLLGGRTGPALAQSDNETVSLKNFDLFLNPEYDDPFKLQVPSLLVMMQGQTVNVTPPFRIKFLAPSAASLYSAGSKDAQDKYIPPAVGQPFRDPSSIPGWDEVSFDLQTATFRVEYYDPNINGDPDKTISYDFYTVYPISNLRAIVQQPKGATSFTSSLIVPGSDPRTGVKGTDGEGFTVYTYNLNNITPGTPVHFDISYTKSGTGTSVTTTPPVSTTPGNSNNLGVILGVVAGAIIIGAAVVWILKSGSQSRSSAPRSERRRASRQSGGGQPRPTRSSGDGGQTRQGGEKKGRFCTKCGAPASATDKFCPSCGAKLRDS